MMGRKPLEHIPMEICWLYKKSKDKSTQFDSSDATPIKLFPQHHLQLLRILLSALLLQNGVNVADCV